MTILYCAIESQLDWFNRDRLLWMERLWEKEQGRQRHRGRIPGNIWSARDRISYIPPKFVIVVFIIVNSVLTVHIIWRNGWHKNASKCTDLHVTIQNFSPCWGGATAPSTNPIPRHSGAARLPRFARGLNHPPMFVSCWCHWLTSTALTVL